MTSIDFTTCNMRDVIARSILMHPSLYREAMIRAAEVHDNYSRMTHDKQAANMAARSRAACLNVYDAIDREDADGIAANFLQKVVAFSEAAKLQCLTPALASDIAKREDGESHA